jgi:hypothetical protein
MDELIQLIVAKTGISEDQAREIIQVVMSHLEAKLPAAASQIVNSVLSGQNAGMIGEAESILSGLLHKSA